MSCVMAKIGGSQCATLGTVGLRTTVYPLCFTLCGVGCHLLPGLSPICGRLYHSSGSNIILSNYSHHIPKNRSFSGPKILHIFVSRTASLHFYCYE